MWKKFVPLFVVLVLAIVGVGAWLAVQPSQTPVADISQQAQPVAEPSTPQPVQAEPGGGGEVVSVPPVPVTSEQPVPATAPVDEKESVKELAEPSAAPVPVSAGGPTETVPVSQRVVQYDGAAFSPNMLTVKKGETVTFVNNGKNPMWVASAMHPTHTAYPTKGGCLGSTFDACKGYGTGSSWSFTFDEVGSWGYHDHLNASAWGRVVVER